MTLAPWLAAAEADLAGRLARGAVPHALLIAGPAGLGKRALAGAFSALLLCERREGRARACGECRACRLLAAGTHPDRLYLSFGLRDDGKPRTELTIDQIRTLGERLAMRPQFGGWQVALIDPADALNRNAANALLKTLEEPSAGTVIVLISDHPARLVATIRSRCQRIDVVFPPAAQALTWLTAQGVADAAAALRAGAGNPGLALALARDGGLAQRAEVVRDLAALWAGSGSPFEVASRWAKGDAVQCLWFAAQLVAEEVEAHARGAGGPLALTPAPDFQKVTAWFREAGQARELLRRGPLRPDTVVQSLLLAWQDAAPQRRRA